VKYQPFPPSLLESGKSYLLINCPDDSVSQSDIKEGDLLLVDINPEPVDGDILMLLYENHVLVRRYYKGSEPETMVLKADSNLLGREVFSTDEIRIVGKLIGKFSRL
jgi:repressor LexA